MYLDIEVQADRYEVEQEILKEIAKEDFENWETIVISTQQEDDDLPF